MQTITIKFDLDKNSGTFKKFVCTDTTDWVAEGEVLANITGYFKITGPMGAVYTGSFATPDTDGSAPDMVLNTVSIPQINAVPEFLFGTYVFEYFSSNDGGTTVLQTTSITYVFESPSEHVLTEDGAIASGSMEHEIDCFRTTITVTDETDYGAYSTLSRTMTMHYPAIAGEADVTSTGPVLSASFNVLNAAYELTVDSLVTYVTGSVTLSVRVLNQQYPIVKCSKLSAQLLRCYINYVNWFNGEVCSRGGHQFIRVEIIAEFLQVGGWIAAYNAALQIGDWTEVEELHDKIEDVINKRILCDCGCDTDKPTIIIPYSEIAAATSYIFAAGPGLAVSTSGTSPVIVTYKIADSFYAFLSALYSDIVDSPDGSVSVSSAVVGTVKTWSLTVKNSLAFNIKIAYTAGNDPTLTVSDFVRQGTRYVAAITTTGATPSAQIINFPHGSLPALNGELAVFRFRSFLTTPTGSELPDKLDVDTTMVLQAGYSEGDYSAANSYYAKVVRKGTDEFFVQVFDQDHLPINMATFIAEITELHLTIKINQ